MCGEILANIGNIAHFVADEVTPVITPPIIKSTEWNVVAQTAVETAKAAIAPALTVLTVVVGVPVAKKVFKRISY